MRHPVALAMKGVGINADLQSMDWSTLVSRRAVKDPPPAPAGWHLFPTAWPSSAMMNPVVNAPLDTSCDAKNWFGWPCDEELVKLRLAYLSAKDEGQRYRAVQAIQARFLESAPYAYPGQYFPQIAYRKDRMAAARPIPRPAPVTSAILPSRRNGDWVIRCLRPALRAMPRHRDGSGRASACRTRRAGHGSRRYPRYSRPCHAAPVPRRRPR